MSTNPIVEAIRTGQAPKMAKLAAARGMLPLGPEETLEVLAALDRDADDEIREAAGQTLGGFNATKLRPIVDDPNVGASVLGFLAGWKGLPRDLFQPVILHQKTPDEALAGLAASTDAGDVIEIISLKQQSLIRHPAIIDAILANPRRTPEADRRAREVREEFFEKDFGAQIVAEEQRAQADAAPAATATAAAPAVEPEPQAAPEEVVYYDDFAEFIEADLVDTGDALFAEFEAEYGPFEEIPLYAQEPLSIDEIFAQESFPEDLKEQPPERISVLARIMQMTVKERIRFAFKGTREVRMILIRDPNRSVCVAVLNNPRITETEIEAITNLKSIHDEVLRLIGNNRAWTKNYNVIHNLVRNPKTPVPTTLGMLNRIQTRDLRILGQSKNVPEVVRTMAGRLYLKRQHG